MIRFFKIVLFALSGIFGKSAGRLIEKARRQTFSSSLSCAAKAVQYYINEAEYQKYLDTHSDEDDDEQDIGPTYYE